MTVPMLGVRPTISVLICAYTDERWSEIVAAIDSVRSQRLKATEIVLVIDHNRNLYVRARSTFPDVTVVENSQRRGLSGARNTGTAICSSDVVAFLDDDAEARPTWLGEMATHFAEPDVVGVGGLVAPWWETERPAWFPVEFDWVVGCSHSGMPSTTATVRNFVGANMSFRREVLDALGGFSADLGRTGANAAGCEETELCIRAASWEGGSRLVYEPDAAVRHHVPAARATWKYFLRRCYGEGRSKAAVSSLAGKSDGLAAERVYLTHTLPSGIAGALRDGLVGEPGGFGRALAIVVGTLATVLGYLGVRTSSGTRRRVTAGTESDAKFKAVRTVDALTKGAAGIRLARPNLGSHTRHVALSGTLIARVGLPLLAVGLWAIALVTSGAPTSMSDLGLLSILSPAYYLAIVVVIIGFGIALRSLDTKVLGAHLVVLLAIFHLTPTILYGTLRYTWAWKHVAIANYVIAHHGVDLSQHIPSLVAYQDWPGFFTLQGLISSAAGLSSPITYANWWPFVNELSYAGPLVLIVRTFTKDRRTEWIALLLFFLGDWIGQDYFSPQGEAYFFYLVLIAVVLKYFRARTNRSDAAGDVVESGGMTGAATPATRAMFWVVVLLTVAIASSHQLTPFMVVSALALLVLGRCARPRKLPWLALTITVGWILLAGRTFVADNGPSMINGIGALLSNAEVHQVNAAQASPAQLLILKIDRLLSASLILLAVVGFFRSRIKVRDRRWLPAVLLAISPGFALGANSYGGEIIFRVYLFSLPFLALFAARAFGADRPGDQSVRALLAHGARFAVVAALAVGFLFSYDGKERANYFSPNEVASISRFYSMVPAGSYITGITGNNPWPMSGYDTYSYYWYTAVSPKAASQLLADPVATLVRDMSPYRHSFVLFTSSDAAQDEMTGALPRGSFARIEQAVSTSGRFRTIEKTSTVVALTLVPTTATVPFRRAR